MKRAMVFIDFDNISISLRAAHQQLNFDVLCDAIREKVKDNNKDDCLIFGNCYYNHELFSKHSLMFETHKRGLVPVYTPSYSAGSGAFKSLCDPMLICDAMESLYNTREIDIFVIVSSDKDFLPLIRKIAEGGKAVIVIGIGAHARFLVDECARMNFPFFDYPQLAQQAEARKAAVS